MAVQDSSTSANPLADKLEAQARSGKIADAMIATWQEIDASLTPIIGRRGVVALYRRSLFLVKAAHPWLAEMREGIQEDIDLPTLRSVIVQQERAAATTGCEALLQTFYELLSTLVGPSLTERLLRSVWPPSTSDALAQDSPP